MTAQQWPSLPFTSSCIPHCILHCIVHEHTLPAASSVQTMWLEYQATLQTKIVQGQFTCGTSSPVPPPLPEEEISPVSLPHHPPQPMIDAGNIQVTFDQLRATNAVLAQMNVLHQQCLPHSLQQQLMDYWQQNWQPLEQQFSPMSRVGQGLHVQAHQRAPGDQGHSRDSAFTLSQGGG